MDPLWLEINEAVHRREIIRAGQLIPRYIKAHRTSPEAIYEASEFYRKITDYSNALRVLPKERVIRGFSAKVSEAQTKLELQQARILNILGASKYALRVVDRIRAENRAKSKVEMVEIYHCNDKYADVLDLIGEDYPLPKSEPWHQDWLLHFYLAHALNGLKQRELAIKRVERIHFLSTSALIRAIALCCKGQYLVESNEPEKALPVLLESQSFFQDTDQTGDHAVLQKWLGICFLRLGRLRESETALKRAFAIFFQHALKPEDWMEIILLLAQIPRRVKHTQQFV